MENKLYHYPFYLSRVIDGDTIVGSIDLGFNVFLQDKHIRLININTPEIRGNEKEQGLQAKSFVENALYNSSIIINSHSFDSFGRCLAEVFYLRDVNWVSLNDELLNLNLATKYE